MRILRKETAAVIIDIQERLFPHIHRHDEIAGRTELLVKGLQVLGMPVLLTQQYTRGLGATIPQIGELFSGEGFIEKTAFSCCDEPAFMETLRESDPKNIILAGIETHVCVLQTALDLISEGFRPVVIEDCVSSRLENDRTSALERLRTEGAIISTSESILFELLRFSGTDEFKSISKLVK
jgi:nicotinamidase-related amidase